jgi:hypothetical protein
MSISTTKPFLLISSAAIAAFLMAPHHEFNDVDCQTALKMLTILITRTMLLANYL